MMNSTGIDIDGIERVRGNDEVAELATAVVAAFCSDLADLSAGEWEADTVCTPWTVADIARHVLGAMKSQVSLRESARQQLHGLRHRSGYDGNSLDALNALQVADHRQLDGPAVVAQIEALVPKSVDARLRRARLFGRLVIPLDQGGSSAAGNPTRLAMGDLFRIVYTRDTWLHRLDVADALGRRVRLNTAADRRIVEDVVKEWADRHGQPFDLRLEGDIDGRYTRSGGGPVLAIDAARLCWILSGRGEPAPGSPGAELLSHRVLF
jgi:uncharacterized protein (TIGR03083 family)